MGRKGMGVRRREKPERTQANSSATTQQATFNAVREEGYFLRRQLHCLGNARVALRRLLWARGGVVVSAEQLRA